MVSQPRVTNYNTQNLFLGQNFYADATYTNSTGSEVTISNGRLLGRVQATNKVLPQVTAATDGSELPIGVAAGDYVVANGSTVTITYCYGGPVAEGLVILNGSDTMATAVATPSAGAGGTIHDLIVRNTQIDLVPGIQLSAYDNAIS